MKKIGILNFQYSDHNYGAVLQAAALQFAISREGYEVEHINLVPPVKKRTLKSKVRNIIGNTLRRIKLIKTGPLPKVYGSLVFEDFREQCIKRTEDKYETPHSLNAISDYYKAIIVGSDQVWRPDYTREFALSYFLNFCGKKTKRISYAASFGVDTWHNNEIKSQVMNELRKFDYITVRENTGVNICSEDFKVKSHHVLDPTLLVGKEFFESIIADSKQNIQRYSEVVFYKLSIDNEFLNQVKIISNNMNAGLENIYYYNENGNFKYNEVDAWLLKIKNSKLVITDSFHCVCFSLLFEKDFLYYANESKGMSRLESLLGQLGLENRICRHPKELSKMQKVPIDYKLVNIKLSDLRDNSLKHLKNSLAVINEKN